MTLRKETEPRAWRRHLDVYGLVYAVVAVWLIGMVVIGLVNGW